MKTFQLLSLASLAVASLLACNSGGRNLIAGRQCPANYNPVNWQADKQGKTWQKGQDGQIEGAIPPGTYVYQRADLIFTQKGTNGAIIHVEDSNQRGVFKTITNCVRNGLKLSEQNLGASVNVVSKMVSKADNTLDLEAKELSFKIVDGRLVSSSKAVAEKPTSLQKIYEAKSGLLYMVPKANNNIDYEVRSIFEDDTGIYVMSVTFKRID